MKHETTEPPNVKALCEFACTHVADSAIGSVSLEGVFDYEDLDGDPDEMAEIPPLRVNVDHLQDALGDYFSHEGARWVWYAYSLLDEKDQDRAARAYVWSGVEYDVSQAILALCRSGDIYRSRPHGRGPVVLVVDGHERRVAKDPLELDALAEAALPHERLIELQEQASGES